VKIYWKNTEKSWEKAIKSFKIKYFSYLKGYLSKILLKICKKTQFRVKILNKHNFYKKKRFFFINSHE